MSYYNKFPLLFSSGDPDVTAFLTATGITDPTQVGAITTLVSDLKGALLWNKFNAIYPIIGGSASSHKFNLVNSEDSDAAFRLAFSGGWTHSVNGMLGNGTNTFADTFLIPRTTLSTNSTALHVYNGTDTATNVREIGVNFGGNYLSVWARFAGTTFVLVNTNTNACNVGNSDARGMYTFTRTGASAQTVVKNGVEMAVSSTTIASTNTPEIYSLYVGAENNVGTLDSPTDRRIQFAAISDGFTVADSLVLYNIIQTYQTTLGRNV